MCAAIQSYVISYWSNIQEIFKHYSGFSLIPNALPPPPNMLQNGVIASILHMAHFDEFLLQI